jgi:hypothetical protein
MASTFAERLRRAMLKPPTSGAPAPPAASTAGGDKPRPVEEIEAEARSANDKERLVGLIAAPLAALIGLLVIDHDISIDPATGRNHVSIGLYHELLLVLLVLSIVMLATAWFRKRAYLGMVMGLYGITVFNLHYWGFGVPFAMVAALLLVRAYRLQKELRIAGGGTPGGARPLNDRRSSRPASAKPNKRYTPPR